MAEKVDLGALMGFISAHWQFNGNNYGGFDELTEERKRLFPLGHSIFHLNKSIGKLATQAEAADHCGTLDQRELEIATAKLLATTLNLAAHLGMDAPRLGSLVTAAVQQQL